MITKGSSEDLKEMKSRLSKEGSEDGPKDVQRPADIDMMKERFAKLLLGEDMSGGGKGVPSALALSNAVTNLAASVFGEQNRLEPMAPETKARWKKEIDWLLSVTDHIVEFVPMQQINKDGVEMEIMSTRQRTDLIMNIPALRKLDAMLLGYLDNFKYKNEFWYASKDAPDGKRSDEKWWLPSVKVPPNGLSEETRKWLQYQKDSVNQVHKAAMAINAQILTEMDIPENYIETLPKNGRESLGESIYKGITIEYFDPDQILSSMDLSTEHKVLDLKNKIEASVVIWKRKMNTKDGKSSWGSAISLEKRELFEERAETILILLKQRFPGLPQSSLDICKIESNRDVGLAVLESYSRVLESLSHTVMSRIEDVLEADALARNPSSEGSNETRTSFSDPGQVTSMDNPGEEPRRSSVAEGPNAMTLFDFLQEGDDDEEEEEEENDCKPMIKPAANPVAKRISYLEKLEILGGFRSPRSRH